MNKSKLSLTTCMAMSVGSIIGAGIFSTTPVAIGMVGNGICWAYLFAAVFLLLRMLPQIVVNSALPASGSNYMQLSRLVHPVAGMVQAFNVLLIGCMNLATISLTFGTYFMILVPSVPANVAAIGLLLIFAVITTFGTRLSGRVQNITVIILLIALGIYIFGGLGHISEVTLMDVLRPTIGLAPMWAAVGVLNNALMGANVIMGFADEVDKPSKTIPVAFIGGTGIVAIIYAVFAYVTIGVMRWDQVDTIASVAGKFLSGGMFTFFITGGALLAVVTTINGTLLMYSHTHFVVARDGLFPEFMSKRNKYGAPYGSIWFSALISVVVLATNINLGNLVKITTVPGLILGPIAYLVIFVIPKKFPNCYRTAFLKLPHVLTCIIAVLATIMSLTSGKAVIARMQPQHYLNMVLYFVACGIYVFLRYKYLKKKGIDLFANMRRPHEAWMQREKAGKEAKEE